MEPGDPESQVGLFATAVARDLLNVSVRREPIMRILGLGVMSACIWSICLAGCSTSHDEEVSSVGSDVSRRVVDALDDSKTFRRTSEAACRAYVDAQCRIFAECTGQPQDSCFWFGDLCPEFHFSSGSTRSVDDLLSCAEEVSTIACSDFVLGVRPAVCGPGTRKSGEACMFGSQCESQQCGSDLSSGTCGACAALTEGDASCSAPNVVCRIGETCDPSLDRCVARRSLGAGDPCAPSGGNQCAEGLACILAESGEGGVCAPLPSAGAACALGVNDELWCAPGAYCARTDGETLAGTCVANANIGGRCGYPDDGQHYFIECDDGYCAPGSDGTPSTCRAFQTQGQPCDATLWCDSSTTCVAGVCSPFAAHGRLGDACDPEGVSCQPLLQCVGGSCRKRSLSCESGHAPKQPKESIPAE
jgi:hypothetical protein